MSNYTPEPELDQSTPRRVRAVGGLGQGCGLWIGRLFLLPHTLAGPVLVFFAFRSIFVYYAVLLAGVDVDGRITKKWESRGKGGLRLSADYSFVVDGVEYSARAVVTAEEFVTLAEGQPLAVRVWPESPQQGHWPDFPSFARLQPVYAACFGALFWNGILSVFLWHLYVRPWRQRQLVRYGVPVPGRVREVTTVQEKGGPAHRISYEYGGPLGELGETFVGKMKVRSPGGSSPVSTGDVLTVLFHSSKPWRSVLYPFADYKAVPPRNDHSA